MNIGIFKIIVAVFVILTSVVVSYDLIKNSNINKINIIQNKNFDNTLFENPIKWINNQISLKEESGAIGNTKNNIIENIKNSFIEKQKEQNSESVNLTDLVAKYSFDNLKEIDQSGKNPFETITPDSLEEKKFIENVIENTGDPLSHFNVNFSNKDFKISQDNSKEAKIVFLQKTDQIDEEFSAAVSIGSLEQIKEDIINDCLNKDNNFKQKERALSIGNAVYEYLNLPVPSDWFEFYKISVITLKKIQLILESLADCYQDPLKGYIAVQSLVPIMEQITIIQKEVILKYKEVGLIN